MKTQQVKCVSIHNPLKKSYHYLYLVKRTGVPILRNTSVKKKTVRSDIRDN